MTNVGFTAYRNVQVNILRLSTSVALIPSAPNPVAEKPTMVPIAPLE